MKNQLLIVIPIIPETAHRAEQLCDWIFELSYRQKSGHVLLVFGSNLHAEQKTKLQLTAEVVFNTVNILQSTAAPDLKVNAMFKAVAEKVLEEYRMPFLWLEPDCVPLNVMWLTSITETYFNQPKRFMGAHLTVQGNVGELHLSRTAVYAPDMAVGMAPHFAAAISFELSAGNVLVNRSSKSRLFQCLNYEAESDFSKIRTDAAILCHDKTGTLIRTLLEKLLAHNDGQSNPATNGHATTPKRRGRPPKIQAPIAVI